LLAVSGSSIPAVRVHPILGLVKIDAAEPRAANGNAALFLLCDIVIFVVGDGVPLEPPTGR
jgi:hypothetical protein